MGANAQTTVPTFTAGQILTADQQNQSARTGVPVFASTTTRDAAFGTGKKTLAEGQLCYVENLTGVAQLQYYDGAAWVSLVASGVVQVKYASKNDTFSTASTSYVDVTGLSVSITPTSASNDILFIVSIGTIGNVGSSVGLIQLLRGSTVILAPSGGTNPATTNFYDANGSSNTVPMTMIVRDSPATTSATTYKVQARVNSSTMHINRLPSDATFTTVSTVTVMEIVP